MACVCVVIGEPDAVEAMLPLIAAYQAVNPLTAAEVDQLFDLILTGNAVSMTMAAVQIKAHRQRTCLLVSQNDVWHAPQRLRACNPRLATMRLCSASCFVPVPVPVPGAAKVVRWLEAHSHTFAKVIRPGVARPRVVSLDFKASSPDAVDLAGHDGPGFDRWCAGKVAQSGADFAVGFHGEDR